MANNLPHITAPRIAGVGAFIDAYDIFCISTFPTLFTHFHCPRGPVNLSYDVHQYVVPVVVGTLTSQLVFGWLGDKLPPRKVYRATLLLILLSAIYSSLSILSSAGSVMTKICFFRFWLGFTIGGDYPLSATIIGSFDSVAKSAMSGLSFFGAWLLFEFEEDFSLSSTIISEYAKKRTQLAFMAEIFAVQGLGIISAGVVSMILSKLFLGGFPDDRVLISKEEKVDLVWRIVLMLGVLPTLLTYYCRMKMTQRNCYIGIVEGNAKQAAKEMNRVLEIEIEAGQNEVAQFKAVNEYPLLSKVLFHRHWLYCVSCMSRQLILRLFMNKYWTRYDDTFPAIGFKPSRVDDSTALREAYPTSIVLLVIALLGTLHAYRLRVFFIVVVLCLVVYSNI